MKLMKFFKLNNNDVSSARNSDPVDCIYADGEFSFYVSETGESLALPFEEISFENLPDSAIQQMKERLSSERDRAIKEAQDKVKEFTLFKSNVLGSMHTYDMSEQDQANLTQAREYLSLMPKGTKVRIRCTDENGVKDNVEHTKEQVNKLFQDWYSAKSDILNAFSTLKIELEKAVTSSEAQAAFKMFNSAITKSKE